MEKGPRNPVEKTRMKRAFVGSETATHSFKASIATTGKSGIPPWTVISKAPAARPNEMAARLLPDGAFPRQRIALDGAPVETVDAEVKDLEPSSWRVTRHGKQ